MFTELRQGRMGIVAGVFSLTVGTVIPAEAPGGERPVYVTNAESADISTFATDVTTGHPVLTGRKPTRAGAGVRQMTFTPDGRTAYAANSAVELGPDLLGTISVYRVGPHGRLTPQETVSSGGETPLGVAVTLDGRTLYVTNVFSKTVVAFRISSDGSIRQFRTFPVAVDNPRGLALSPDGRFLFLSYGDVTDGRPTSVGGISTFVIGRDGGLTEAGPPVRVGRFDGTMATTPDGRYLYLTSTDTDQVFGFAIGAGGGLTALPRSPYAVSDWPEGIATTPDGRFVYIASVGLSTPDGPGYVTGFAIGADGSLTAVAKPVRADLFPVGFVVVPSGRFAYASGGFDAGRLSAFAIGTDGKLKPLDGTPFDTRGFGPAYSSASVLPDQGPVAGFAAVADHRSVTFNASSSADPDGSVASYGWDFGDGTTATTTAPRTTHRYARAGTFRVTLTVTDDEGCSTVLVSTGQGVLRNGTAAAATTRDITVSG
ncbi:beta-propeller fold lactonase family protein [Actinoplanes awajinensis]|nr:beta-propeller fold lactonase family protein [Actinoplanes awajinensis]